MQPTNNATPDDAEIEPLDFTTPGNAASIRFQEKVQARLAAKTQAKANLSQFQKDIPELDPTVSKTGYQQAVDEACEAITPEEVFERCRAEGIIKKTEHPVHQWKRDGNKFSCPNPTHPDNDPSAAGSREGKGLWYCPVCDIGGDKYTLAGYLYYGHKTGRAEFNELCKRMAADFRGVTEPVILPSGTAPPVVTTTGNVPSVATTGTTATGGPSVPPTESTPDEIALADWAPKNLATIGPPPPTGLLKRTDDFCLLYEGMTHAFIGSPSSGKTWATLKACADEIMKANRVMFIDFEDDERLVRNRLLQMGLTSEDISEYFTYIGPTVPIRDPVRMKLAEMILEVQDTHKPYTLVVLDGVTPIMAMHGYKINDADGAVLFINAFPKWFARLGPTVIYVDHPSRNGDGTEATGSFYKEAGARVTYVFRKDVPFTPGQHGVTNIFCKKDKSGAINEKHPKVENDNTRFVGVLHGDSDPATKQIKVWVDPPGFAGPSRNASSAGSMKSAKTPNGEIAPWLLKKVMEQAYKLQVKNGGMSKTGLRVDVGGKTATTNEAIQKLINDGYLVDDGRRGDKSLMVNNDKTYPGVDPLAYFDEYSAAPHDLNSIA